MPGRIRADFTVIKVPEHQNLSIFRKGIISRRQYLEVLFLRAGTY